MIKRIKEKNAITLLALIITIIILLILATVSISLIINSGILDNAQHGVDRYSEEEELEQIKLAVASARLKGNGFLTTENLNSELQEKFGEDKEASETSVGWFYTHNKNYRIYKDGHIENADILPEEYQQVEYIENNVAQLQYIDTEVIPNENTSVILDMMTFSSVNQAFFGCIEIDQRKTWRFFDNAGIYFDLNGRLHGNPLPKNVKINIELHNYYVVKDGIKILESNPKTNLQLTSSLYIFTANGPNGVSKNTAKTRIYSCKIYNRDLIVRNFIPCYKELSDNNIIIGLYDTVEGKFYVNHGEGTFIKGADV